jgi:ABC-type dipeptide/oligopeptide/nickel transport system permease component
MEFVMKKLVKWIVAAAVVGALAGCVSRTAPIDTVQDQVATGHTEAQVRNAILKAGLNRQWIMTDAGPGVIKGRQQSRGHTANILVQYSANSYIIKYDGSTNLMAEGGKIHKNYNRWVHNLSQDIQISLASATQQ